MWQTRKILKRGGGFTCSCVDKSLVSESKFGISYHPGLFFLSLFSRISSLLTTMLIKVIGSFLNKGSSACQNHITKWNKIFWLVRSTCVPGRQLLKILTIRITILTSKDCKSFKWTLTWLWTLYYRLIDIPLCPRYINLLI